jgi:hypothetical protein
MIQLESCILACAVVIVYSIFRFKEGAFHMGPGLAYGVSAVLLVVYGCWGLSCPDKGGCLYDYEFSVSAASA